MPSKQLEKQKAGDTNEVKYRKLRRFNLIMGFLHLVQGILDDPAQQ